MKILNRYDGKTICEDDAATMRETVINVVKMKISLQGAYLQGAYLQGAYLGVLRGGHGSEA